MSRQTANLFTPLALTLGVAFLVFAGDSHAAKKKTKDEFVVTDAELQLELMSFADRYAAVYAQAIDDVEELNPPSRVRRTILADGVFSSAAAFTIAADPEPQLGLLDMVVMVTMGRMVYEDYWPPKLGSAIEPVVSAFELLEKDIWTVAASILDDAQQQELHQRIAGFHKENPGLSTFSHLRFADFPSKQPNSTLKKSSTGGIFKSVKNVTEQVELTRILAERAMYLSSRLPLLSGGFADIWVSRLADNPEVSEMRTDLHTFADVSERLAVVAEQLPETVAAERSATIEQVAREATTLRYDAIRQLLDGIAAERRETIRQLVEEEPGVERLLTELRETLTEADTLTGSVDTLAQRFDAGAPPAPGEQAEPFDIDEYRATVVDARATITEANGLVQSANELLNSPGADRLVPSLVAAIHEAGETSEDLVDHSFLRAAALILIALIGYVLARLCTRWLERRVFGAASAG